MSFYYMTMIDECLYEFERDSDEDEDLLGYEEEKDPSDYWAEEGGQAAFREGCSDTNDLGLVDLDDFNGFFEDYLMDKLNEEFDAGVLEFDLPF